MGSPRRTGGFPLAKAKPVSRLPLSFEEAIRGLSRADPPVSFLSPKKARGKPKKRLITGKYA